MKHKMKSYIKIYSKLVATALLFSVGVTACDYLDVVPPETADIPDTMKDKQDALEFLYSCYSGVNSNHGFGTLGTHEASSCRLQLFQTTEFSNSLGL